MKAEIVIAGGGIMGASVAFWLSHFGARDVVMVERDPIFEFSASSRSASGMRQQFSSELNIKLSQLSIEIIRNFEAITGTCTPIRFTQSGYLICAPKGSAAAAQRLVALQNACGARTVWLTPSQIAEQFPGVRVDDLDGASWGAADEGWFDGVAVMTGFREAAKRNGVRWITGEVAGITRRGDRIERVTLADGSTLSCTALINATGAAAGAFASRAGLSLPVYPRKREVIVFESPARVPKDLPLITDASGMYVRPEGDCFFCGMPPRDDPRADPTDFNPDPTLFEEHLWPALAHRIPGFEELRVRNRWVGHYEFNEYDQNALIGPHPECASFFCINGFSGHGLQQAAAAGRGLAELIVFGAYRSVDLAPFSPARVFETHQSAPELRVI
ncbi:MAG: FAD-binding oxidoreductase [Pseudomonadota bacterium]